jgi:replicative DNA helicase
MTSKTIENVPPFPMHDDDAEQAVMAACCAWPDAVDAGLDAGLRPEHFHRPGLGNAFQAACVLVASGQPVDAVTVPAELARLGLPGPSASDLLALVVDVPSVTRVAEYAAIVVSTSRRRRLLGNLTDAVEAAKGPGSFEEVAASVDRLVTDVLGDDVADRDRPEAIGDIVDAVICRLIEGGENGVRTGYRDLDQLLGPLSPGSLVLVAGRPSLGKTAFVLGLAQHAAWAGVRTLFASAEQSRHEIGLRQIADIARVPTPRLRPPLTKEDLEKVSLVGSQLADLPLVVTDRNRGAAGVAQDARRVARRDGLGLVVVDYLQLLAPGERGERRELEVAAISRQLKTLAVDLRVPVVCAAQLNRDAERREGRRPRLADLRESGALEQDADVVLLLHRDDDRESPFFGTGELIVAKNRNGPIGSVHLSWLAGRMAFVDCSPRETD